MNIKTLNISLLSFSIITALFPLNAMATKLTIEQRLELLENELSQNKQELKATQNELGVYKSRLSTLQKSITENKYKSASLAEISDSNAFELPLPGHESFRKVTNRSRMKRAYNFMMICSMNALSREWNLW